MNINQLKQARRRIGLSQKHMAILLETDESNISKYERDVWPVSKNIMIAYFIITGVPVNKLVSSKFINLMDCISGRVTSLIHELESDGKQGSKTKRALASLHEVLSNISCLKEVTEETKHE